MQNASIFKVSVEKQKDSKALWKHFRIVNNGSKSSENGLPDEIEIKEECFNDSIGSSTVIRVFYI